MIRLPADNNDSAIGDHVKHVLQTIDPNIRLTVFEFVVQTSVKNWLKVLFMRPLATLAMMLIYVGSRFEWRLGFGIASLAHDVVITLGVFSGIKVEMDLTFVAINIFRCRLFHQR